MTVLAGWHQHTSQHSSREMSHEMSHWRCPIGNVSLEIPNWRCPNGDAPLVIPNWRCPTEDAALEMPQWRCSNIFPTPFLWLFGAIPLHYWAQSRRGLRAPLVLHNSLTTYRDQQAQLCVSQPTIEKGFEVMGVIGTHSYPSKKSYYP